MLTAIKTDTGTNLNINDLLKIKHDLDRKFPGPRYQASVVSHKTRNCIINATEETRETNISPMVSKCLGIEIIPTWILGDDYLMFKKSADARSFVAIADNMKKRGDHTRDEIVKILNNMFGVNIK